MATKQVYTAKDGRKYKTTSQADAERLAGKLQKEKAGTGVDPNMPTISLQSETFREDGTSYGDKATTKTFTDTSGKTRTVSEEDYQSFAYPTIPRINARDSYRLIKDAGLTGLVKDDMFSGLTAQEANERVADLKRQKSGQFSSLTSYGFNPSTVSGAKKTLESFNVKLSDINSDPWLSKGSKKDKVAGLYESTANEYAKLFDSPEQFESMLQGDADFAAGVDAFKRAGGDVNSIRSRISAPVTSVPTNPEREGQRQAIEGLVAQGITDPGQIAEYMNEAGRASGVNSGFTAEEVTGLMSGGNEQTTADYLAGLTDPLSFNSTAEKEAFESLIPERELAQNQVMRLASVPQQYKDIYFGTPEAMGILQEKRIQAEEKKKILEKKAQNDERSLRARADYAIDANNADMEIEDAQIEENRLAARNYATGMLAKLGALNTTGAAPVKLAQLEQKYQQQKQVLRTTTRFANQKIELDLKEKVDEVEVQLDTDVLTVSTDLTKDKEEVLKEIQKLEQTAWDKIYSITDKAANELRTQKEKYVKEAKALAEKNAKAAAKAAESYDVGKWGSKITGGTEEERKLKRIAQYQEVFTPGVTIDDGVPTIDDDGFITAVAWKEALKEAPSMGITKKDLIENFGSMLFLDNDGMPDPAYGFTAKEKKWFEGG